MKKYLILIPIIGIFAPSFIKNWDGFVEKNYNLVFISLWLHIISIAFIFAFTAK